MRESETCWDRFDRKTLLAFTGYKGRAERVMSEIERVGIDSVDVQWQFPCPFDKTILNSIKHERGRGLDNDIRFMSCTLGHYKAIKKAYHLGCENILVMEDDIRFLKDTGKVEEYVRAIPEDFDVAMLDLFPYAGTSPGTLSSWRENRKANELWAEFDDMFSMGCYAMSRRAMERYIWLNEAAATDPSVGIMRVCDHYLKRSFFWPSARLYFARENVAVQRADENSNSKRERILASYRRIGIDMSRYAE